MYIYVCIYTCAFLKYHNSASAIFNGYITSGLLLCASACMILLLWNMNMQLSTIVKINNIYVAISQLYNNNLASITPDSITALK